jgi:hypothetical protein
MLLFYRYQVNDDGTLIDNDNGRIIWPFTENKGKVVKPFHLVLDDNGKRHYFSVKFLLEKLGSEIEEIVITERVNHKTAEVLKLDNLVGVDRVNAMLDALLD